jgi:hypothetical protein
MAPPLESFGARISRFAKIGWEQNALLENFSAKKGIPGALLEPEVGFEPTTCALRGTLTVSHSIPLGPVRSHSVPGREVLPRASRDGVALSGTRWDPIVGTKLGQTRGLGTAATMGFSMVMSEVSTR